MSYSSSSLPVFVSQSSVNSRAVVFLTLHRGQRDTIIYPYLINCTILYLLPLPHIRESSVLTFFLYSSRPSSFVVSAAAAVSLAPARSTPAYSNHYIFTLSPCFVSAASQMPRSYCVAIYCVNIFWIHQMYFYIISNPASAISASTKVYSHFPSSLWCDIRRVSCRSTWSWKPPRNRPIWGLNIHVSAPKSNTDWTTDLKKNPDTHGLAPSLLKVLVIVLQKCPWLIQIKDHGQKFIICRQYQALQVLEGQYHI